MKRLLQAILGMALLPMCLFAQEENDSTAWWKQEQNLKEVVVVGQRTVLKQSPDRIVYLTRNDIYAKGLNGIEVLDRIPRVLGDRCGEIIRAVHCRWSAAGNV